MRRRRPTAEDRDQPAAPRSRAARLRGVALVVAFLVTAVLGLLTRDRPTLSFALLAASVAILAVGFVVMPDARAVFAGGPLAPFGHWLARLARLQPEMLAFTIAGGIAAILGSAIIAYEFPRDKGIRAWIAGFYPAADPRPVPGGGTALVYESSAPPTLTAARIDDARPADDERYTPAGILLRYERDIVAVLPRDGLDARRSDILVERDAVGHRHFARLIGDAWGPRYGREADVPPSAMPVPDAADSADLRDLLSEAAYTQRLRGTRVCYGWDLEIRSGRRKGRWSGSTLAGNAPHTLTALCDSYVALLGWIDPRAGRFGTRSPGDYALTVRDTLDPHLPNDFFDRVRVGPGEVIVGSTTEPNGSGTRAGKGVLELARAMPLLAAETGALPPVPLDELPVAQAGPLAPVERSDLERGADEGAELARAATFLRLAGIVALVAAIPLGAGGLLFRLARAGLRRVRRRPPPGRDRSRRRR